MSQYSPNLNKKKFYQKKWFKISLIVIGILILAGGAMAWKMGVTLNKISLKGNLFGSLARAVPGVKDELKGEADGRINIVLLGMRGEHVPSGGLLADTIMVASIKPAENKLALISIPRDLFVDNPSWGTKTKINAVYAAGEENGKKQGISDMKKVLTDITGIPIHYGVALNFQGFVELIDALGGIEVNLSEPFTESIQFNEPRACDNNVFTIPTGKYDNKKTTTKTGRVRIVKSYPLCFPDPKYVECGGNFNLPAGINKLDGKNTLCYTRARYSSSDFERARRQQQVLKQIKEKAFSLGTLSDFGKVNDMLNALEDNVKTDMEAWEMKRVYEIYQKMTAIQMFQKVLENSEEGLLYAPPKQKETGYILLPRGDNFDKVKELFQNAFSLPTESE
jgi:polyisoprenyl-teichoic acid--peptidoglycan teichoic acid transferase